MAWHIHLRSVPSEDNAPYWVSFESDPRLTKTKGNIYGRCLPCIQNLYEQLKVDSHTIDLGNAYNCWKITVVLEGIEQSLSLLAHFEKRFPSGHVYGKIGSGRANSKTKVVVFHTDNEPERDRLEAALNVCLVEMGLDTDVLISRACAVLYEDILGDWREWGQTTPIRYPERVEKHLARIKDILFRSSL